ncbi:hypothetical protein FW320_06350 [Azospirillum sp. Vi22]|uniref:hypothetical protein n=1 Tax=Azospirillum baldaniorum TaxID=1064539 RepID=UPI00157ACE28|nr:hypothetical protein [Azospirillum baldaniorum]NUB05796.1 hypothetical protein [Azospirillum baldaniorum]
MSFGLLADRNEVAAPGVVVTSNKPWSTTSPLSSIRALPLADTAVSVGIGTEAAPTIIDILFPDRIFLTYAGLIRTSFRQSARYRCEAFADAAGAQRLFTSTRADGRDRAVIPPLYNPAKLRWGAPELFRGDLPPSDFALFPTNVHVVIPLCRPRLLRWTIWGASYRPDGADDTAYRIAYAWAGDSLQIMRHLPSPEGYAPGDQVVQTPGGATWVEPGVGKRLVSIERQVMDLRLRDALFENAMRVGYARPLIWLPNVDRPEENLRYGGLYRRREAHEHRYISGYYTSTTAQLEEWTT